MTLNRATAWVVTCDTPNCRSIAGWVTGPSPDLRTYCPTHAHMAREGENP